MFGFNERGGRGRHGADSDSGGRRGRLGGQHSGGFGGIPFGNGPFGDAPFGGAKGGGRGRGGFGHGGGDRGGFGGGGRRGKRFEGEELRLMVLGLLAEEAQHGYQLIRAFAEKSGGVYQPSPGVLYPLLAMLEDMGLVAELASEGSRRSFALNEAGKAEVAAKQELIAALFARLAALAQAAGKSDAAPVRRALHNLRSAVIERLEREGAAPDLAFEVAKIIDEATQRIERL